MDKKSILIIGIMIIVLLVGSVIIVGEVTGAALVLPRPAKMLAINKIDIRVSTKWSCSGPATCSEYISRNAYSLKDCKERPGCTTSNLLNWFKCKGIPKQQCSYYDDPMSCEKFGCKWIQQK